jgi:YHS domain-containing protein
LFRRAQTADLDLKNFMKMRMIWIAALAVVVAASVEWFEPRPVSAQSNAPAGGDKILYYTCPMHPSVKTDWPGRCPECGMALVPVYAGDVATNKPPATATNNPSSRATNHTAAAKGTPRPYPLDTCVVDGMKLGSMGDPYVLVYEGQEIKFCCANCQPVFLKDPAKYLKKIQDAEAAPK